MGREQFLKDACNMFENGTIEAMQEVTIDEIDDKLCGCPVGAVIYHKYGRPTLTDYYNGFCEFVKATELYNITRSYVDGIVDGFDDTDRYDENGLQKTPDYNLGVLDGKEIWDKFGQGKLNQ